MQKVLLGIILVGTLLIVLILSVVAYDVLTKRVATDGLTVLQPTTDSTATTDSTDSTDSTAPSHTHSQTTTPAEEAGLELAADFTVYDAQGNAHKLSDYRGKPVVLNFWASWCGPCKSEMPDFEAAYGQYGDQIHFLMVNLTDGYQETKQSAEDFLSNKDYTFPVYFDTDMNAAMTYGVTSVPVTYFIDRNGYLVAYGRGMLSAENLAKGIGMILP